MRRGMILSALMVAVTVMLIGGSTMALFNDIVTSGNNEFKSGTLGMKQSDDDEGPTSGTIHETWVMQNMKPCVTISGDTSACDANSHTVGGYISYYNDGSLLGSHIEFDFSWTGDSELAKYIQITWIKYDADSRLVSIGDIADSNGNGYKDLEDLTSPANSAKLRNLLAPNAAGNKTLWIDFGFSNTAGNDMQGKSLIMDVTATLVQ
ncbi:MAG: SipW-dependent-type signal peptide-containing protein [Thermoleophilia bacterium]